MPLTSPICTSSVSSPILIWRSCMGGNSCTHAKQTPCNDTCAHLRQNIMQWHLHAPHTKEAPHNDTCTHHTQNIMQLHMHPSHTEQILCNDKCTHLTQNIIIQWQMHPLRTKQILYNDKCTHLTVTQNKHHAPQSSSSEDLKKWFCNLVLSQHLKGIADLLPYWSLIPTSQICVCVCVCVSATDGATMSKCPGRKWGVTEREHGRGGGQKRRVCVCVLLCVCVCDCGVCVRTHARTCWTAE